MTPTPKLALLIGPVGAGKSTFGRARAATHGGIFLDLDTWMVRLYGADPRPADNIMQWYLERRDRCRELLWDLATDLARTGTQVTLELGLITATDRETFYARARDEELQLSVYLVDAPRDIRRDRVEQRNQAPGPYTQVVPLAFFERASDAWEPPTEREHELMDMIDI